MDAVVFLNKPAGMSSFQAAAKCRRIFSEKKAGHTGTLDPNATGLLVVLLGKYTKLVPYCAGDHKTYEADFCFGKATETEDIWGTVTEEREPRVHTAEELEAACLPLIGESVQIPPMYSAVKQNGRKLYELARKGVTVERKERKITVEELSVKQTGENSYHMHAVVSGGTYIRTLICDYASSLGELACMTALVRTGIGNVTLDQACTLEQLAEGYIPEGDPKMILDPKYPLVETDRTDLIYTGRAIKMPECGEQVIFTHEGEILAAYGLQEDGLYHCLRGLF